MTEEELADYQLEHRDSELRELVHNCRRRFLAAASLLAIGGPVFDGLREAFHLQNLDLASLYPAWEMLSRRYRSELFDPQPGLFLDHGVESRRRWGVFLYEELFPHLLHENEFVRNTLRTVGLVPCKSKQKASSALCQYLEEMGLPFSATSWDWSDPFDVFGIE